MTKAELITLRKLARRPDGVSEQELERVLIRRTREIIREDTDFELAACMRRLEMAGYVRREGRYSPLSMVMVMKWYITASGMELIRQRGHRSRSDLKG